MFKASQMVKFCQSMVGMPYWYGTCVYRCSLDLLARKTRQYPQHYTSSRMSKYRAAVSKKLICMDCIGMIKGFFWTNGGEGVAEAIGNSNAIKSNYGSNGCPDKSADGMLSWLKSKGCKNGKISTLPDVPGILLFSSGHVGVYVGGGYAIEARGFNYGVVKTKVSNRSWTSWAYLPSSLLEYDMSSGETSISDGDPKDLTSTLGSRLLKRGSKGDDVAQLQKYLVKLGYNLGTFGDTKDGVDGEFGAKTEKAVKEFQKTNRLESDGEYGKNTHAVMLKTIAQKEDAGSKSLFTIKVIGKTVNVRNSPDTKTGKVIRVVRMGDVLSAVGTDPKTGWYKLSDGNYISNQYTNRA